MGQVTARRRGPEAGPGENLDREEFAGCDGTSPKVLDPLHAGQVDLVDAVGVQDVLHDVGRLGQQLRVG